MNNIKRLCLGFIHSLLNMCIFLGNNFYKRECYKNFRSIGIDFSNGKLLYINYDADFNLLASEVIHIGFDIFIAKGTIVLVRGYSIKFDLFSIRKINHEYEAQFLKDDTARDNCFLVQDVLLPRTKIGNNRIIDVPSVVRGII